MDLTEVHEKIVETHEGGHHHAHAENHPMADEKFRKRVAILVGAFAVLAAISGLGGREAMKEMINANIQASDTYAYYQAKTIRQALLNVTAETLEANIPVQADPAQAAAVHAKATTFRTNAAQLDSDPASGTGRKELLAKAKSYEEARDEAQRHGASYEYAEALVEIAVVLSSTSIVAASRSLLALAMGIAGIGVLLGLNGILDLISL